MRILFITSVFDPAGTVEAFQADVVKELAKHSEAVYVVALKGSGNSLPANVSLKSCPYSIPLLRVMWLFTTVLTITVRHRVNLYLSYISEISSIVASLAAFLTRRRNFYWYCSIYSKPRLRVLLALKMATLVLTCSDATAKLYTHWRIKEDKIANIGHGVASDKFTASRQDEPVVELDKKRPIVLSVGRFSPVKEWDVLVQAISKVKNSYGDVLVLAIGETPGFKTSREYFKKLRESIDNLSLETNWIFHGPVPNNELHKYFSSADVCVFTGSAYKSVLESLFSGRPTLVSDKSARIIFGRAWRENDYLKSITFRNADELADLIIKVLREEHHIMRASQLVASDVYRRFSMEAFVQRLLNTVLGNGRRWRSYPNT